MFAMEFSDSISAAVRSLPNTSPIARITSSCRNESQEDKVFTESSSRSIRPDVQNRTKNLINCHRTTALFFRIHCGHVIVPVSKRNTHTLRSSADDSSEKPSCS